MRSLTVHPLPRPAQPEPMVWRLSGLRLPLDHDDSDLPRAIQRRLRLPQEALQGHRIVKRSVDAREQQAIRLVYCLDLDVQLRGTARQRWLERADRDRGLRPAPSQSYSLPHQFSPGSAPRPLEIGIAHV